MAKIRRALLSVTDKTGIVDFARRLSRKGVELISTGGTARVLREAKLTVKDVSEVTGFPEMLDGRVKTLHPNIAGGILAIRSDASHTEAIEKHGIAPIDMVVVNLYAFEKTASKPGVAFAELIENIDIGGPTLIRAAAKNFRDVAVVTNPRDYPRILSELSKREGDLSPETLWYLAQQAFAVTAAYDRTISRTLTGLSPANGARDEDPDALPALLDLSVPRSSELRYGENPHQKAALYTTGESGVAGARQLHGKELSYNNLVDLDASWALVQEFNEPAVAIIKHTNPCGCAEQPTLVEAYRKALECDPVSAFGSVISVNRELDAETAAAIGELFVEAVAAPGFSRDALKLLTKKKNLRLIEIGDTPPSLVIKSISGGFLAQTEDRVTARPGELDIVTKRKPSAAEMAALEFAWKVVKHVKSNAIVYAVAGQTVGVGAGQMSRVDAARLGASKAILPLKKTVVASDAFFPFPDGVEEIAKHGAIAVIQPGGSVRDKEVIAAADKLKLAMVFTGVRHFRH
ncbi:MAG: bifunctional phosphoribosylaminoimidazolecarboxamide formyltransferase/IMP cyclohydrolase [Bryobacterales bacterium]